MLELMPNWRSAVTDEDRLLLASSDIFEAIFIGHGGSPVWHQLQHFLTDRLRLGCDEFNSESVAGKSTAARLQQLLDNAAFAFLVMTAEDTHPDGSMRPRENVIHEAGLFQGRLGFERAIILLEQGCAQFSNIHGLTHIPFPKNNLEPAFEKIRQVLEREGLLPIEDAVISRDSASRQELGRLVLRIKVQPVTNDIAGEILNLREFLLADPDSRLTTPTNQVFFVNGPITQPCRL